MRIVTVLTLIGLLSACSGSDSAPAAGGWKKGSLAGGRVTFEMPGISSTSKSTDGQGSDAVHEEKASCEFDSRVYDVRVLSGPRTVQVGSPLSINETRHWRNEP
jgi:hypothetical protein